MGFTSRPGQGSTFWFILPAIQPEGYTPKPAQSKQPAGVTEAGAITTPPVAGVIPSLQGLCVLLVEDNIVNQRVAAAMLKKLECQFDLAENGQVALDIFPRKKYDVILMDCDMPVMDGFTATREIRKWETDRAGASTRKRTVIIALTANAISGDKERCLECGMDGYLSKPARMPELRKVLLEAMPMNDPGSAHA